MNKEQFLNQLSYLLQDIAENERNEAMDYYTSYFEEAGASHEQDVINELGSPEKVAAIIKGGLDSTYEKGFEYGDSGVDDNYQEGNNKVIEHAYTTKEEKTTNSNPINGYNEKNNTLVKILIVIAFVILIFPIGGTIGGLFVGFIGLMIALFCTGIFGTIGLVIGSIALIVAAVTFFTSGAIGTGILLLGIACLLLAASYLTTALAKLLITFVPKVIRGIVQTIKNVFNKVGA
ncbi:MAG: hypothetical protein PHH04_06900 [Thomasclavelia sp.]|jgi:uncharacterized membrane protein|nr:hypothetical protein [Thomasclavelia sp.]